MEEIIKVFSDDNRDNWIGLKAILSSTEHETIDDIFEYDGLDKLKYEVLWDVFSRREDPHSAIVEAIDIIIDNLAGGRRLARPKDISEEEQDRLIEEVRINISKYLAMQPRVMTRQPYQGMKILFGEVMADRLFDTMENIWLDYFPTLTAIAPREEMIKKYSDPLNVFDSVGGRMVNYLFRTTENLIFHGAHKDKKRNIAFNWEDKECSDEQ